MYKEPVEEARRWLEQAREDLKWANKLAEEGGCHIACFLAQLLPGFKNRKRNAVDKLREAFVFVPYFVCRYCCQPH